MTTPLDPLAELRRLELALRTHVDELERYGATPDVRMTYDDLCAISALLDRLTSPETLDRACQTFVNNVSELIEDASDNPWSAGTPEQQEIIRKGMTHALSSLLKDPE
jgi:hypothetical protein